MWSGISACLMVRLARVFSRADLTDMAGKAGFGNVQFRNLMKLPGNSLMTAVRS